MLASENTALRDLFLAEVILVACVVAGWLVGRILLRFDPTRLEHGAAAAPEEDEGGWLFSDSLAIVGGAFGIIIGLQLVFAAQHFVDAKDNARDEAATSVALFQAVGPLATEHRDAVRRDLVCYMRSVAGDDWSAVSAGYLTGAPSTVAWSMALHDEFQAADTATGGSLALMYSAADQISSLDQERQQRLLYGIPEIPLAIWVVVYVGTTVTIALMVLRLQRHRRAAVINVVATTILLGAVVGSLSVLDVPYAGLGATLKPVAMNTALLQLETAAPGPLWDPCPQLPPIVDEPVAETPAASTATS